MAIITIPVLDIRYKLTDDASPLCVPSPYLRDQLGIVYLKTNQEISLAYNNYLQVHTGIILLTYPELTLNTTPKIRINTVAKFYSIPELREEDGIEVINPYMITSEHNSEIILTIKNNHKPIFNADRGDPIAIMELSFIPKAEFFLESM